MRRDGEIALRRVLRRSSFARNIKFIRRGVIYPARGRLPHRRVPGRTMCAPTRGARRGWVCGWPQGFPQPVGADSISARKLRATANRADIESAPTIYPPKYLSPPKNQKRPPHTKPKNQKTNKAPPKTTTPAHQPFSLNGRRAGFSCQVFLATLITGHPVCSCVFCPQSAPQWPPPPRSARRAPPPAGTCRWSAARTTARRSASGLRPRCRP